MDGAIVKTNADFLASGNSITFKTPGQYLVDLVMSGQTTTAADIHSLYNISYTYKGVTTTIAWADYAGVTGTTATAGFWGSFTVSAEGGSVISLVATSAATSAAILYLVHARVANYLKTLG